MLIATWILAVSTAILAIGGPIAFATYLGDRRAKRQQEFRDRVLRDAEDKFITKADAGGKFIAKEDAGQKLASKDYVIAAVGLLGVAGLVAWNNLKGGDGDKRPLG